MYFSREKPQTESFIMCRGVGEDGCGEQMEGGNGTELGQQEGCIWAECTTVYVRGAVIAQP